MNRLLRFLITFSVLFTLVALQSMLIKPFVVFAVYLHQIGHFISAITFSLRPNVDFIINFTDVSYTLINPKGFVSSLFIASAGYTTNLVAAILILKLMSSDLKKYLLGGTSLVYVLITLSYDGSIEHMKNLAVYLAFIIIIYMIQSQDLNDLAIRILAYSNILFVLYDTGINTIYARVGNFLGKEPVQNSIIFTDDTTKFFELTRINPILWGVFWFGITILVTVTLYKIFIYEDSSSSSSSSSSSKVA